MTTRFGNVEFEKKGSIAIIIMDDPAKLNAKSVEMRQGLWKSLARIEDDDDIRVAILTGRGEKAFCAGGDISSFSFEADSAKRFMRETLSLSHAFEQCTKPLIAAVNGLAFGGGFELALACDFILSSDLARFALPEIQLGLLPGFAIVRLHEIVGRSKAKELSILGKPITAGEAYRLGIVLRIVDHQKLLTEAMDFAEEISLKPSIAVALAKSAYNRGLGGDEMRYAIDTMPFLMMTDDTREGVTAFREKRKPKFKTNS